MNNYYDSNYDALWTYFGDHECPPKTMAPWIGSQGAPLLFLTGCGGAQIATFPVQTESFFCFGVLCLGRDFDTCLYYLKVVS